MDRDSSPDLGELPRAVHGWISYVDRKTGQVKQRLPIDAEKISIGRDADCDIRVLWEDVSRVHAEIHFDLLEGAATLVVTGSGGLHYVPIGQPKTKLAHSMRQPLQTGDQIIIRKQPFRFDYAEVNTINTLPMSPSVMGTPVRAAPTPSKRRASHRLSLMPADKPFMPLSPMKRRQSHLAPAGSTPRKSLGSMAVQEAEEEDEEELMEGILDVQQNENGDMIVLEARPEEPTSPARAEQSPVPPKTPRSVPLPASSQTPYVQTPPRVSSKVAMSTPPGPMTLHKALLLRSARKAWVETRSNDVDNAVDDGKIQVRRKSWSPSAGKEQGGKRKSMTPKPSTIAPPSDDDHLERSGEADEHGEADALEPEEEQTYEAEEAALYEGDSAEESLEADMSLDIVTGTDEGDEAVHAAETYDEEDAELGGDQAEGDENAFYVDEEQLQDEEDDLFVETPASFTPVATRIADRFYTPQAQRHTMQPRRSLAGIGGPAVRASGVPASPNPLGGGAFRPTPARSAMKPLPAIVKEEENDEEDFKPDVSTPVKKSVSDRELAEIKKRRQSLATPRHLPSAPMSFRDPVKNAFSLVKSPSHPALTRSRSPAPDEDADETVNTPLGDIRSRLNKMKRDSSAREVQGRRATVGFALPETPDRPVIQTSASYTAAPATRFAGFAPPTPNTPGTRPEIVDSAKSTLHQTPVRTPASKRTAGTPFSLMHHTPIQESPEASAAIAGAATAGGSSPAPASPQMLKTKFAPTPAKTPDNRGTKTFPREEKLSPKTPYMGGIKSLYPVIPTPASPALAGIKNMYPVLPLPPKRPDMRGLKGMFAAGAHGNAPATPAMEGLGEMFALASPAKSERGVQAGENSTEVEEEIEERSPRPVKQISRPVKAPAKRAKKAQADESQELQEVIEVEDEEEEEEVEEVEGPSSVPARRIPRPVPVAMKATSKSSRSTTVREPATTALAAGRAKKPTVSAARDQEEGPASPEKPSAPSRRRAAVLPAASAESKSKPSRRTAAASAETAATSASASLPAASKPPRARTVPAKIAKSISAPSAPASPEAPSRPSRATSTATGRSKKAALGESTEQPVVVLGAKLDDSPVKPATKTTTAAEAVSKPARASRPTKVAPAPAAEAEGKSAPTRSAPTRPRAVKASEGEKENVAEAKSAPSRGSRATKVIKKDMVEVEVQAPVARATRSRK